MAVRLVETAELSPELERRCKNAPETASTSCAAIGRGRVERRRVRSQLRMLHALGKRRADVSSGSPSAHEHAPHDLVFVRPRKVPEQGPDRVGVHEDIGVQEDENLATRSRCEPVHAAAKPTFESLASTRAPWLSAMTRDPSTEWLSKHRISPPAGSSRRRAVKQSASVVSLFHVTTRTEIDRSSSPSWAAADASSRRLLGLAPRNSRPSRYRCRSLERASRRRTAFRAIDMPSFAAIPT